MYQHKLQVSELTGLSRDAVHSYVGLLIFFWAVALLRKGRVESTALVPVFVVAAGMDVMDLYGNYITMDAMYWGYRMRDLTNTVFWPLVIVLLVRFKPLAQ